MTGMHTLSIGDFSRATHLGVKALREYHRRGLLIPDEVDDLTGYRRYGPDQIAQALLIKRFRELDLPLDHISALLRVESVEERRRLLEAHLSRLISDLQRMHAAAADLADLLQPGSPTTTVDVRTAPAARGAAIEATVQQRTITPWFRGAVAELQATLEAQHIVPTAPMFGLFDRDLFVEGEGKAIILIPTSDVAQPLGRVVPYTSGPMELAVVSHQGSHLTIDRSYGALGAHVARHEIGRPGPIRETYLHGPVENAEPQDWVTEVGWPVFHTRW